MYRMILPAGLQASDIHYAGAKQLWYNCKLFQCMKNKNDYTLNSMLF